MSRNDPFENELAARLEAMAPDELESLYREMRRTMNSCRRHRVRAGEGFLATMFALGDFVQQRVGEEAFAMMLEQVDAE